MCELCWWGAGSLWCGRDVIEGAKTGLWVSKLQADIYDRFNSLFLMLQSFQLANTSSRASVERAIWVAHTVQVLS